MTSTAAGPDQPGLAAARTTGATRFLGPDGMGRQSFIAFVGAVMGAGRRARGRGLRLLA